MKSIGRRFGRSIVAAAHAVRLAEALSMDIDTALGTDAGRFFARLTKLQLSSLLVSAEKDDEARRVIDTKADGAADRTDAWRRLATRPLRSVA